MKSETGLPRVIDSPSLLHDLCQGRRCCLAVQMRTWSVHDHNACLFLGSVLFFFRTDGVEFFTEGNDVFVVGFPSEERKTIAFSSIIDFSKFYFKRR